MRSKKSALLFLVLMGVCAHAQSEGLDGAFTSSIKWSVDPDDNVDVLEGSISFMPAAKKFPTCQHLSMIQVARLYANDGTQYVWQGAQAPRNSMETLEGYFVDHDASKCRPKTSCSPYFRDSWPNADASQDGFVLASGQVSAVSLMDYPVGWDSFEEIDLESCVACRDNNQIFQCVRWGASWKTIMEGKGDGRSIFPVSEPAAPSTHFMDALKKFDGYYGENSSFTKK